MSKVNVLVVSQIGLHESYLEDIAVVDSRISAKDGIEQFVAELRRKGSRAPYVDRMEKQLSLRQNWQAPEPQEDLDTLLAQAEIIFGVALFPEDLLSRAPKLKWIHIGGTGIDLYLSTGIFEGNVTITNSRGVPAVPISEHVLGFMFMLAKNAERLLGNKQDRRWERFVTMELRDRTVGIIGLGAIGSEVARLAKGIGMRVLATRRSATGQQSKVFGVDEIYPPSNLLQMLSESDFVVVAAPLTAETMGLIGEAELRAMQPTAYLINIARGRIVDQSALIRALREGWIAGAGLDVFESEPLPADSELWELPNVLLSSHMAGSTDRRNQRVLGLFCDNLKRYLAGEQLLNVVDLQKGY
ncbi:D-2-hydroxyacid dehydrogenase [Chloroflexota bacterium]